LQYKTAKKINIVDDKYRNTKITIIKAVLIINCDIFQDYIIIQNTNPF